MEELNFEKFMKDIAKREEISRERKAVAQATIEEDIARRRRAELYHERWQNRILWEKNNVK
tara:strand:+ start:2031 stop:2213 length:183 start_codon:yes stop_codon:yes gene_type:complete